MIWCINTLSFNLNPKCFFLLFNKILDLLWRSCVKTCFWTCDVFSLLSRPPCRDRFLCKDLRWIYRSKRSISWTILLWDVKLVVNWCLNLNILNHFLLIILEIIFTVIWNRTSIKLSFNKPFRSLCWVWFDIWSWF